MTRVIEAMPALDPTLEGAARSTLGRMQHDLQTLHGKMIQAAKRRDETLRRQFTRTRALAFPGGHPRSATIGFVSFLNQYGPALVERLDEELPLDLGQHWIVAVYGTRQLHRGGLKTKDLRRTAHGRRSTAMALWQQALGAPHRARARRPAGPRLLRSPATTTSASRG